VSGGLKTYVRKSASDGSVVFLDNQGTGPVQNQIKLSNPAIQFPAGNTQITVAANEIRPVVVSAKWTANATLAYVAANVLGKLTAATKTYYVLHGRSGESGEIAVQYGAAPAATPANPWNWDAASKTARGTFTYPTGDTITELPLDSGDGSSATFIVVNTPLANRTWLTDKAIYVGASYVDDDLSIQTPMTGGKVAVYGADGRADVSVPTVTAPQIPAITTWQWRDAASEAAANYDDSTWSSSPQPQPFGANNFQNGYGWYRAKFTVASAGNVTATIGGGVRASAMAFANGKQVSLNNNSFSFPSVSGDNTVAILAKHEGLDKMYNVTGATGTGQYAGIWGNVTNGGAALASAWKFRGGLGGMDETAVVGLVKNWTTFLGGTWADTQANKSWPAFWRGSFKSPLNDGIFVSMGLRTSGLSSGSAWVNGHNLGRFSGNTLLYVPEAWLTADNAVVIYDASGNAPTGAKLEYIETRVRYGGAGGGGTDGGAGGAGAGGANGAGGRTGAGGSNSGGAQASGGASGVGGLATGGSSGVGGTHVSGTGGSAVNSGGAGGLSAASAGGTGGSEASAGGSGNGEGGASGCSCSLGGHSSRPGAWLVVPFALLLRRRKSAG
jgi:hypothetical protein